MTTRRIEYTGTSNTFATGYVLPICPDCEMPVHAINVAPEYEDVVAFGTEAIHRVGTGTRYELSPCGHVVSYLRVTQDEHGNRTYSFTPALSKKLTPRLKKIREALGL